MSSFEEWKKTNPVDAESLRREVALDCARSASPVFFYDLELPWPHDVLTLATWENEGGR